MLHWPALVNTHEWQRVLHDLATAVGWVARASRVLLLLVLWPLIFGVLAMIAGLLGWHGHATGPDGIAGQLFSLMLALFILVTSQALVGREDEI